MSCNRPLYYPFLNDAARERIDAAVLACIDGRITEAQYREQSRVARTEARQQGRSQRTETRQTEQTERVTERMETAQELGYYATDLLYGEALPAFSGAVASVAAAAAGVPLAGAFPAPGKEAAAPPAPGIPEQSGAIGTPAVVALFGVAVIAGVIYVSR